MFWEITFWNEEFGPEKKSYEKQTMVMHVATFSQVSSRSKIVLKGKFSFPY